MCFSLYFTVHTFMPLKNSCHVLYTVMDALKYTILPDAVLQLDVEDIPPEFIYIDHSSTLGRCDEEVETSLSTGQLILLLYARAAWG